MERANLSRIGNNILLNKINERVEYLRDTELSNIHKLEFIRDIEQLTKELKERLQGNK